MAGFEDRVFRDDDGEHGYVVFLPKDYSPDTDWPVVLFLHGASERGTDGRHQLSLGLGPVVRKQADTFPFVAVFPQCEDLQGRYLTGWLAGSPDANRALAILEEVEREYSIDSQRRVLTGWSMGGYGTWSIAAQDPSRWSAILPLAGGGETAWAERLKDSAIWAFHGENDGAIRPQQSRRMIAALRDSGASPRYTEIPGGEHDITGPVYQSQNVIQWMLDSQSSVPTTLSLDADLPLANASEFVPAMHLRGAATVRLGNRMLDALAMSVPDMLPKELLSGKIENISDSTVVQGRNFGITFGDVSYATEVWRVRVKARAGNRINVQIGLTKAKLRIGGTSVIGRDHSASAGPIEIVIGSSRPAWLTFDVEPQIENREFKLKLVESAFRIENDNWYVTNPAWVRTRGLGMTRQNVSDGLTRGLYGNKSRIEKEVRNVIPMMIAELEKNLTLTEADKLVSSFWPLPVYHPRVRLWPQELQTDDSGISLVLGLTAAAVEPWAAPKTPASHTVAQVTPADISRSEDLQLAVAPQMLGYLTQLMVDADVARIHVLDIPELSFAEFNDVEVLREIFPELKRFGKSLEVASVLELAGPIEIGNEPETNHMRFAVPRIAINVAVRQAASEKWQPFAGITVSVGQDALTELVQVDEQNRALQLHWTGDLAITAKATFDSEFTPQNNEINTDRLAVVARSAWTAWAGQGPASRTAVPDIELGLTQMRLSDVGWKSPWLGVTFSPPGVKITNSSEVDLVYGTRGPYSNWGGPYVLAPGETHEYEIAHPLGFRRRIDGEYVEFTLAPGSHSEFRAPQSGGPPRLFRAREDLNTTDPDVPESPVPANSVDKTAALTK
jgi:dienelactone hydrolase